MPQNESKGAQEGKAGDARNPMSTEIRKNLIGERNAVTEHPPSLGRLRGCGTALLMVVVGGCATVQEREGESTPAARITFEDVTEEAGLEGAGGQPCAWGDFDGDGYADVMIGARLFHNSGDGTFVAVPAEAKGE